MLLRTGKMSSHFQRFISLWIFITFLKGKFRNKFSVIPLFTAFLPILFLEMFMVADKIFILINIGVYSCLVTSTSIASTNSSQYRFNKLRDM